MTKRTLLEPLARQWLRGPAWQDGESVVMDCARAERYELLAHPKLGLELARVKAPADAVAFVGRFGLLRATSVPLEGLRPRHPTAREPFADFVREADTLRRIIETALHVRRAVKGDAASLKQLRDRFTYVDDKSVSWLPKNADDRTVLTTAGHWATWGLCNGLIAARPYVYDRAYMGEAVEPGLFRIGILPETLIEVCYLTVAVALAEKEPIEICPACDTVFVLEDPRQRFCTPKCAGRVRFRRFKEHTSSKRKGTRHGQTATRKR
jgi:hypothetical protein